MSEANPTRQAGTQAASDALGAKRQINRRSTGGIVERANSDGSISYHARFRAAGRRRTVLVGNSADGIGRQDAERALTYELERVRRGEWAPPVEQPERREVPTLREAASDFLAAKQIEGGHHGRGLAPASVADLRWRIDFLLAEWPTARLDQIDVAAVDNFRRKLVRRGLSPASVNKALATLSAIFAEAIDHRLVGFNPAVGKRRRLPAQPPRRTFIDRSEQIEALLDAAGELDRERSQGVPHRRALIATLVFGGLRIGELLKLRRSDVHLASGRLRVIDSKTDAGRRHVDLLPVLVDELGGVLATLGDDPNAYVFATTRAKRQSASNVNRRILSPVVERANKRLVKRGAEPISEHLTPHSLRRTYASILYALGETPPYVMEQMGHADPSLALAIYAKRMNRRDGEPERLRLLVNGSDRATAGNQAEVGNGQLSLVDLEAA